MLWGGLGFGTLGRWVFGFGTLGGVGDQSVWSDLGFIGNFGGFGAHGV